jgi:hypothetical protein
VKRGASRNPFSRPLDRALERLRAHRLPHRGHPTRFDTWSAVCPACRTPDWTLTLRERGYGGVIDVRCVAGCTSAEIHGALERDPSEARVEAAEAREAQAWEIVEELRALLLRALELAIDAQSEPTRAKPLRIAA